MFGYRICLSLSLVGARRDLLTEDEWPFALRFAVGSNDNVDPGDVETFISSSLPWNLWPTGPTELLVHLELDGGSDLRRVTPATPQYEQQTFLDSLKAQIVTKGQSLAAEGRLSLPYVATPEEVTDDGTEQPVPWAGLMQTLSSLAPPTPSALLATWYFKLPRDVVARETGDGTGIWELRPSIRMTAAPVAIPGAGGARHAGDVAVKPGPPEIHIHQYGNGVPAEAHCEALWLGDVLKHDLDELDNFWMTIRDSRDDSLLDMANRLEQALQPVAMIETVGSGEFEKRAVVGLSNGDTRAATTLEVRDALNGFRHWAEEQANKDAAIEARRTVVRAALETQGDPIDALEQQYLEAAKAFLTNLPAPNNGVYLKEGAIPELAKIVQTELLPRFRAQDARPVLPGEGIDLVIGDPAKRLRHEEQPDQSIHDVAGLQLFGRRSSSREGVDKEAGETGAANWHALTAGRYELAGDHSVQSTDRLLPVTAAYVDGVLTREISYGGSNLVCRNPLSRVHREDMAESVHAAEQSLMLAPLERVICGTRNLLALPLRYADFYEFAASVMDRGGGMASEVTTDGSRWELDLTRLDTLSPPQRDRVQFLRRVPVGVCNLLPAAGKEWPQIPAQVWPRSLEVHGAEEDKTPCILLVPGGDGYAKELSRHRYEIGVEPPRIDEHTLLRWKMPATDLPDAERQRQADALKTELKGIHERRDQLMTTSKLLREHDASKGGAESREDLPFDPAVSQMGLRWRFDSGAEGKVFLPAIPLTIAVEIGNASMYEPGTRTFFIAPGDFVRLELSPLVEEDSDFARMDAVALRELIEQDAPWEDLVVPGVLYRAFKPVTVYAETASAELPTMRTEAMRVRPDVRGDVEVLYSPFADGRKEPLFRNVHQFELASARWVWRNLPVPPERVVGLSATELARRLASGPPASIVTDHADDADSELVRWYDSLSGIDTGFVERPAVIKRLPRIDKPNDVPLHVDGRDQVSHADYLRYKLRVRSRYAGVLVDARSNWTELRRVALPFRGDPTRIKSLKVLAVLPLTRGFKDDQLVSSDAHAGTPFLVIFDELWFREYGLGERLEARIATAKQEIGDTTAPTELRYGPLPDHSVTPPAAGSDTLLRCFGPFGFSLDRTGSQAKANATGFVVYPPPGTPPHYNMFVEFRRLLDLPSGVVTDGVREPLSSETSEAVPIYTLPDSNALAPVDGIKARRMSDGLTFSAPRLAPFAGASEEALRQYRYLLIVGRMVRDGGRTVDVFLPEDALWVSQPVGPEAAARWLAGTTTSNYTHGVFAEILLNGRPGTADRLAQTRSLQELFQALFSQDGLDAPGMFRRVSSAFAIQRLD